MSLYDWPTGFLLLFTLISVNLRVQEQSFKTWFSEYHILSFKKIYEHEEGIQSVVIENGVTLE